MTDEEEDADNEEESEVDEDAEIADIDEKIGLNEKLLLDLHETENDLLSNKILGVEERILELQDRREKIKSEARRIEEEEEEESEARRIEEEVENKTLRGFEAENDDDSSEE